MLKSFEKIALKLWKEFAFEIIFGLDFLVSKPRGRKLQQKDTWRRTAL